MGFSIAMLVYQRVMWVKECHKPPMTGNGLYIPPINMVMAGGWFMALFYPHYEQKTIGCGHISGHQL